jgi:tetratricopeptide (TPR) repeat protein
VARDGTIGIIRGTHGTKLMMKRLSDMPRLALLALMLGLCACAPHSSGPGDDAPLLVQVLPFEVQGQEEGTDYVGWAFAQSLAGHLSQSEDLKLLEVPTEAGEAAGAATRLITGTVTREGDSIQASLQLLDPITGEQLWQTELGSERYGLSDLAFQLAAQAAEKMNAGYPEFYEYIGDITGGEAMSASPLVASSLTAWRSGDNMAFLQASSSLVAQFGDDPAAHAIDAWALMISWDAAPLSETRLTRLKERLVELDRVDPESPYDEIMLGYVYRSSGQPDQARALYSRVVERKDLSNALLAWTLRQRSFTFQQAGNAVAAREDAERAVELDPSNAASLVALSRALEAGGALDEAISASERALALQPSSWRHLQRLGIVLTRAGKPVEATIPIDRACQLSESKEACANLACTLQRSGREAEAAATAEYVASLPGSRWGFYNIACYQAMAGQKRAALDSLRRSIELGFADTLIKTDPDLDILRQDPAFRAIEAEVEERISSRKRLSTTVFPWQA